ncbi:uncharacterized protein LOC131225849 [Magnolia sinica]|uniref:uncharacterized protein LOC131225849 n=1 Tax=Magnolia sinica TaxID=86752 RepID=UPI002659E7FA|nr:uncharacterized protein LOC131225849 [Magnolia sinica]XP_058077428.1 uncharacterized protein LOC131225849 [Magnolia sinica]XP_058077429.1 uncharacterized protein LOC131225849 [Magnolia sinica]XP_058077430.1 uncharacterized protein LOC131225849 [Magnolia sinica]XP_058077431.1 uncharacterized protein LOC131225849 [Magnolia sinica]
MENIHSQKVNYTTRCAPSKFYNFIKKVNLKDEHIKVLEDTPFKGFMHFPKFLVQRTFLNTILTRWDDEHNCFLLGGKRIFFKPQDIAIILGLSMNGEHIDLRRELSASEKELKKKYFANVLLKRELIEENIKNLLEESSEESISDFAKLFILYLFNTILFPIASETTPIFLLHYVNELENLHSYAWATAIWTFLVRSISESVRKKKKYVNGCVMVLEPWLHEHIILPSWLSTKMVYPRILRWVDSSYRQTGTHKKFLDNLICTQIIEDITPTNEESHLLPLTETSNSIKEIRQWLEPYLVKIEEKIVNIPHIMIILFIT